MPRVTSMYYLYKKDLCVIFLHFVFDLNIFMTQTSQSDNLSEFWVIYGKQTYVHSQYKNKCNLVIILSNPHPYLQY